VTPINTVTNKAGKPIGLAISGANDSPGEAVITPNGRVVYVLNTNEVVVSVTPIRTASNTPGSSIPLPGIPFALAVTPNSKTVYVANNLPGGYVTPIDTATDRPGATISVGGEPFAIGITPNGRTAYVVGTAPGLFSITPLNTSTNQLGTPIPGSYGAPMSPQCIAITPNGRTIYIANGDSNDVTPISTATNKPGRAIKVGEYPTTVLITPNGKTVYAANIDSDSVTPINVATNRAGRAITIGKGLSGSPVAMAITPNGKTLYAIYALTNYDGRVVPISTATGKLGKAIKVGDDPIEAVITP
jgi:YVTN family beta-propeller protein